MCEWKNEIVCSYDSCISLEKLANKCCQLFVRVTLLSDINAFGAKIMVGPRFKYVVHSTKLGAKYSWICLCITIYEYCQYVSDMFLYIFLYEFSPVSVHILKVHRRNNCSGRTSRQAGKIYKQRSLNEINNIKQTASKGHYVDQSFKYLLSYICPQSTASQHARKLIYHRVSRMLTVSSLGRPDKRLAHLLVFRFFYLLFIYLFIYVWIYLQLHLIFVSCNFPSWDFFKEGVNLVSHVGILHDWMSSNPGPVERGVRSTSV